VELRGVRRPLRLAGEPLRTGQVTAAALGSRLVEALATMRSRQVFVHEIHGDAPDLSLCTVCVHVCDFLLSSDG
jgi:hypothetical protein